MERTTLAFHERQLRYGSPRLLQTDEDLIMWRFWHHGLEPSRIGQQRTDEYLRYYRNQLSKGYIGAGLHRLTSAVFAIFDHGHIISAGSVELSHCEPWDIHAPVGYSYARIDNGETSQRHRGIGLNTQITRARIEWARQINLSCVQTTIDPKNFASIRAKLRAGFIIDSIDKHVSVLFPLSREVKQYRGLHSNIPLLTETYPVSDLPSIHHRLDSHFGIMDNDSCTDSGEFFVRLVPREFGIPTRN